MPWAYLVDPIRRLCGLHGPLIMFILESFSLLFTNTSGWLCVLGYLCDRRGLLRLAHSIQFLSAFAKSLKATISFVISVRPSVRPHVRTRPPLERFSWNLIFECFSKNCLEYSSFCLKSDKNNWHITWRPIYILNNISLSSSQSEKCFRKKL